MTEKLDTGDVAPPADADATPPETTPEEKKPTPPEGSPRWEEVYGKMKTYEREVEDLRSTIGGMADHNKALGDALDRIGKVEDQVATQTKPDKDLDPEGYENWIIDQAARRVESKKAPPESKAVTPEERLKIQLKTAQDAYPDYNELVTLELEKEILEDPYLRREVWGSDNPALAAYKHAKKKRDRASSARERNLDQGAVESGGEPPPPAKKTTLTAEQKRVASALGVSEENYIKQLKHIEGVK